MKKIITVSVTLITIGLAGMLLKDGINERRYQETTLGQAFGKYGRDITLPPKGNRVGPLFLSPRGGHTFLFIAEITSEGDTLIGRYEEILPDRFGNTPGTIWVNGVPWSYAADGSVDGGTLTMPGLEVYTLTDKANAWVTPPLTINLIAADSLWHPGGNFWLVFDDCSPDSLYQLPRREKPNYPYFAQYQVVVEQADSLGVYQPYSKEFIETDGHSDRVLMPGTYRVWFAMVDPLGMLGQYIGPLQINAGECP